MLHKIWNTYLGTKQLSYLILSRMTAGKCSCPQPRTTSTWSQVDWVRPSSETASRSSSFPTWGMGGPPGRTHIWLPQRGGISEIGMVDIEVKEVVWIWGPANTGCIIRHFVKRHLWIDHQGQPHHAWGQEGCRQGHRARGRALWEVSLVNWDTQPTDKLCN